MTEWTSYLRGYLFPGAKSPWRWEEKGRVLAWSDGSTIAFRTEVERALQRVSSESQIVPPFLGLALLFALARSDPRGALASRHVEKLRSLVRSSRGGASSRQAALDSLAEIVALGSKLGSLPADFWSGREALELLVVHVVERSGQARDPHASRLLARSLERGLPPWSLSTGDDWGEEQVEAWIETFSPLRHGLSRFDAEALLLRARTGLDRLPAALDLPIDSRVGARDLLESLRENAEFGALVALARTIAAMLHIPRPVADRSELPLGGVSDISNRGSLERLLPSELAHDDLTLAIRIATNEALYMRREAPFQPRSGMRCILLDTGIRSWGTPRVFGAAVALGLAAAADPHDRALVWRSCGESLAKVDLSSREGLADLLSALEPDPEPSAAFRSLLENTREAGKARELFLIVTQAAAESRELRDCLFENSEQGFFLVVLESNGRLRLESWGARGVRVLRESRFDLDALRKSVLAPAPVDPSFGETVLPERYPAFLLRQPLPLLFSYGKGRSHFCARPDAQEGEHFQLTPQGDVVHWFSRAKAGRVLQTLDHNLRVGLFEADTRGCVHIVHAGSPRGAWYWTQVDSGTAERTTFEIREYWDETTAALLGERLVLGSDEKLLVLQPVDGGLRVESARASVEHLRGRYFRSKSGLFALTSVGGRVELTKVSASRVEPREVLAMFDLPGRDGPWTLSRNAPELVSTATGEVLVIKGLALARCSALQVLTPDQLLVNRHLLVDLRIQRAYAEQTPALGFPGYEPRFSTLRSIGCSRSGDLLLSTKSSKTFVVRLGRSRSTTGHLAAEHTDESDSRQIGFAKARSPFTGFRIARSPAGGTALSDWRGLLHLRSSDPSIPEITIALVHDRPLRVWCSDGWACGSEPFLPEGSRGDAESALLLVRAHAEGFR